MIGRRNLLRGSLLSGGILISGFDKFSWPEFFPSQVSDPFRGNRNPESWTSPTKAKRLWAKEFSGRARWTAVHRPLYAEAWNPVTPTSSFYIRTRASKLLDNTKPWSIQVGGLIEKPSPISVQDLEKIAQPMGLHLMECAGNSRSAHFGMLSVADWEGIPIARDSRKHQT